MYAIQNIKTGKFVYGTDYRYYPRHQRTSHNRLLTYDTLAQAKSDYLHRQCGKDYRIVVLKTVQVKRQIPLNENGTYTIDHLKDWEDEE